MMSWLSNNSVWLLLLGGGWLGTALSIPQTIPAKSVGNRPNIILILADDMGYSDLGCMGSELTTPNLDRLAAEGLLMTNFYNTGRCCPTRASLLTGLFSHQAGVGDMTENRGIPAYQGFLNDRCVTLAEALKKAGYITALSGKWHLGEAPEHWPQQRGFDHFFGVPKGGGLYFYPALIDRKIIRDGQVFTPDSNTFYSTDAFNDYASDFIRSQQQSRQPFFLYLAHVAPHFPLQARPSDIARHRGHYRAGFSVIRQQRYERQKALGIIGRDVPLSPSGALVRSWEKLTDAQRDTMDLKMAIYAAQIERLDQGIGRLVQTLRDTRQLDNTLLLFLSDNGGEASSVFPITGATGPLGSPKSWSAYGPEWANVSNTPFRLYKQQVHEGGIRTPLIAHWPKVIGRGRRSNQVGHVIDLMPTLLELTGAAYPAVLNGVRTLPMEGKSLAMNWKKGGKTEPRVLYWEHEGNRAVRQGDWKLVSRYPKNEWELYNLAHDPTEECNLAVQEPEWADALRQRYGGWANRVGVRPWATVLTLSRKQ